RDVLQNHLRAAAARQRGEQRQAARRRVAASGGFKARIREAGFRSVSAPKLEIDNRYAAARFSRAQDEGDSELARDRALGVQGLGIRFVIADEGHVPAIRADLRSAFDQAGSKARVVAAQTGRPL